MLYLNSSQFKKWRKDLAPDFTNSTLAVILSKNNIAIKPPQKTLLGSDGGVVYMTSKADTEQEYLAPLPLFVQIKCSWDLFLVLPLNSYPPKHDHCKQTT